MSKPPLPLRRVLSDGSVVVLRLLERDDSGLLCEVFDQLGPVSRRHRFLGDKRSLTASDLRRLTSVDHRDHEAIVALSTVHDRPIGVSRFVRSAQNAETAEPAVVVVDDWQGRGVGTVLGTVLVARARALLVRRFAMPIAYDNGASFRLVNRLLTNVERTAIHDGTAEVVGSIPALRRPRRGAHGR